MFYLIAVWNSGVALCTAWACIGFCSSSSHVSRCSFEAGRRRPCWWPWEASRCGRPGAWSGDSDNCRECHTCLWIGLEDERTSPCSQSISHITSWRCSAIISFLQQCSTCWCFTCRQRIETISSVAAGGFLNFELRLKMILQLFCF